MKTGKVGSDDTVEVSDKARLEQDTLSRSDHKWVRTEWCIPSAVCLARKARKEIADDYRRGASVALNRAAQSAKTIELFIANLASARNRLCHAVVFKLALSHGITRWKGYNSSQRRSLEFKRSG